MACLYPRTKVGFDAYSGERKVISFPCGCCVNCLVKFQNDWAIRINETAQHYSFFIYDTFTIRDSSLEWVDNQEYLTDPDFIVSKESEKLLKFYGGLLPVFPKHFMSDLIHRAKARYFYDYGVRPKWKYVIVMEYGPKTSRPHAHAMFFGISHKDYVKYIKIPWTRDYGFVKTKYIFRSQKSNKDVSCISRYVAKYVNKGVFESPLVKNWLQPKPWRIFSNGLGIEYTQSDKFNFLLQEHFQLMKSWEKGTSQSSLAVGMLLATRFKSLHYNSVLVLHLSKVQLRSLLFYVDENGFTYSLPRYYRDVLLGRNSNFLKYEVQNLILQDAEFRRNQEISRIATSLGRGRTCVDESFSEEAGLSCSTLDMARYIYFAQQKNKSILEAKRHYNNLRNHYLRPKKHYNPFVLQ